MPVHLDMTTGDFGPYRGGRDSTGGRKTMYDGLELEMAGYIDMEA